MPFAHRVIIALFLLLPVWLIQTPIAVAQDRAKIEPELNDISEPITVVADIQENWEEGATTITSLKGGRESDGLVRLVQGRLSLLAETMVIVDTVTTDGQHDIYAYAKGRVSYVSHGRPESRAWHLIRLQTVDSLGFKTLYRQKTLSTPNSLMVEALNQIDPARRQPTSTVSLQVSPDSFTPPQIQPAQSSNSLTRRIRVRPRSSQPLQFESSVSRDTVPEERVIVLTGGVNVLVEGLEKEFGGQLVQPGIIDLSADRVIIWTDPADLDDIGSFEDILQNSSARLQIYLEGNILVRQKDNTITATHAFFDANNDRALLLNAELRAFLPQTGGEFRVRAARLRQVAENKFHAQNAWTTTSPYGKPGYRLQSRDIFVEPGPISPFTKLDPLTGGPANGRQPLWITALDSQFMIGDTPVFRLPKVSAPAEDPNIPIRRAVVKHDRIFGLQVKTVWNLSKVLGQPNLPGMQWDLLADYLSERGPGLGVQGEYDMMSRAGRTTGNATVIYQYDSGNDNLGADRKALATDDHRGAAIWRHKQELPGDAVLFGEIGYISDRNYLESFHENRFDTDKDAETLLGARQDIGAWSGSIFGKTELNDFEASTGWLPRADVYGFSQPILNGMAYWSSHSSAGYADMQANSRPGPDDPFTSLALPYHNDASGLVAMTRHQVDAPFFLGPVKVNPFVMGEAAFWNEGLTGNDVDRYLVSGGAKAHLAATKIMPFVRSDLWRLNGLVHKTDTYLEYRYTDVSRGLNEISQFNEIDDNSTERFRIRYTQQIFPGLIPNEFDPRNYAVRTGAGLWVSAPYHELAADQETVRLRMRQRLQTKVGPQGSERIRDWMIYESGLTWFPDGDRDNFGESIGLLYGNYRWNINDRTSILADGVLDLFDNSQDVWSIGVLSQRSTRGSMYLGFRQVEAKNYLDSQTLVASYSYQMSPKWISTGAVSYDVAAGESRGSSLTFSRVGLDWVVHVGLGIDTSKDNVGVAFALEPRFGPPSPTNLSYLLGLDR